MNSLLIFLFRGIVRAAKVMQFAITKTLPSIAIACKDVDYARVFQRGREHGLDMLHVVPASAEAQPAIPPEIEAACSQTLVVKPGPDGACVGSAFEESEAEGEVVDRLASLGYWDPESALATRFRSLTLRQAVACFLHVNREHGLDRFKPFYPVRTVMPSLHEFLLQKQDWSSKPEGMLCLTGLKGDVTHQQMRFGSWPEVDYFAGASRNLVRRVLRAFGYLDSSHNSCMEEALALFVERNARKSANKRLLVDLNSSQGLHDLFVREDLLQQWWLPPKDSNVRASLRYFGYLPSIEAGKDVVMESMRRFLRSKGASKLPASYNTCVAECLEVLSRNPDARTAFMRKPREKSECGCSQVTFHLLKNMFHFSLLVLKRTYHYWTYHVFFFWLLFFSGGLKQMEVTVWPFKRGVREVAVVVNTNGIPFWGRCTTHFKLILVGIG